MRLRRQNAVGMVEYSLIGSLVAVACIIILALVGTGVTNVFQQAINGLTGQGGGAPSALTVNIANAYVSTPGDLPGAAPSVTITGPSGFNQTITASRSFPGAPAGTYTITAQPFVATPTQSAVSMTFYPTIDQPSVTIPSANNTATVDYTDALPSTSHRITGADLALVTGITEVNEGALNADTDLDSNNVAEDDSSASYVITTSSLPFSYGPTQAGDVLSFDPGTYDPASLLVKVTGVSGNTIYANQASIYDLIARLSVNASTPGSSTGAFTNPLIGAHGAKANPLHVSTGPIHAGIFSMGCGSTWPTPSVTLTGNGTSFNLVPTLDIQWSWISGPSVDRFGLEADLTTDLQVTVDTPGNVEAFCQTTIKPFTYFLPLIPVPLPIPIPIWIDPTLSLNVTAAYDINPNGHHPWLTEDASATANLGFMCTSSGCSGTHSFSIGNNFNFLGNGKAEFKVGPRMDFKLEGLVGPYIQGYVYGAWQGIPNINGAQNQHSPSGTVNGCYNGEAGLGFTEGIAVGPPGPFKSLWAWTLPSQEVPFFCAIPPMAPAAPSRVSGIDFYGCSNPNPAGSCTSTDGYNTVGDSTGPGQIQFNPDNSQPRWTREGSITASLHFPATLQTTINYPGSCLDPNNNVPTNCPFGLQIHGRTNLTNQTNGDPLNGGQLGGYTVTDANGYVYYPNPNNQTGSYDPNTCQSIGDDQQYHYCNDVVLFGSGHNGFVGNGITDTVGCGGNECVDGGQLNAQCRKADGTADTCAGHTINVIIYYESNGKTNYTAGGNTNYPTQSESWFDGVTVGMPYYPQPNNWVIVSPASAWSCSATSLPAPSQNAC